MGCMVPSPDEANIARIIALRLGCGKSVPGYTVQRNCASGMEAIDNAVKDISMGRHELVLAGGTEAMSRSPLLFNNKMVNWFAKFMGAKTTVQKLRTLGSFRLGFLSPIIALLRGLRDPLNGMSMGQTAEELAYRFNIDRQQMDSFSVESHLRVVKALEQGFYGEVSALYDAKGGTYEMDDGVRPDSSVERLAKLRPFFDKKFGMVTPGNSSQVTDGAAVLLLASADAVKKYNLPVLGRIIDTAWAANEPAQMGLGPVHATAKLLKNNQLKLDDINFWEINEAFAAQVIACLRAWEDKEYCQKELGLDDILGTVDMKKVNIDGGAVAMGHPVGATGARLVLHLLHVLKRNKAKRGVATLCIGGGQGGAMLVEQLETI